MTNNTLKIALLCGGPSLERGISLNSARSVCDHLHGDGIEILPIYFDHHKTPYEIDRAQLYSNTPSDFDFKLHQSGKPLSKTAFEKFIKNVDLAFPVMHGSFGEDGQIQRILQKNNCPYVGSDVEACKRCFDKFRANEFIKEQDFFTLPSTVLIGHHEDHRETLESFFKEHNIERAVVKPATGGSSIAVYSVSTVEEALEASKQIFSKRVDNRAVVEPFCTGIEFTVIILQNRFGLPVAILPTEIEIDYSEHQIFDYRKKYLATRQVTYHCPPRFNDDVVERIQIQSEQLFTLLGMQDFARFDGWLMPDGKLWFSDFNPISGMEQNSFLFQQSSRIGMSHRDLLRFIVKNACRRNNITFPSISGSEDGHPRPRERNKGINVIFGGKTAERQVSVMSGTNAWLKLKRSDKYSPQPYLLDMEHNVWKLPYALTLNHTVEEIEQTCKSAKKDDKRLHALITRVVDKLNLKEEDRHEPWFLPEKMSLEKFIDSSDHIFIGLHGGIGEDGTLQKTLEDKKIPFNGSGSESSKLCMNKYETAEAIKHLKDDGVTSASKKLEDVSTFSIFSYSDYRHYWRELLGELGATTIIVKPVDDGCSSGIARLIGPTDLSIYMQHVLKNASHIPNGKLKGQHGMIDMPAEPMKQIMFEQFIKTDDVRVIQNDLKWNITSNWIEITMGVVGKKNNMKAMSPSITVASGNVLSLEEKFQGGTGVNITPPPQPYVKKSAINKAINRMEKVAKALDLSGYARIDAFMHTKTGELIIIEANTTPALTPSTVIFHQALEEENPMYPTEFLEKIV